MLGMIAAGCVADRFGAMEATTPRLTAAQVTTLKESAQTAGAFGIEFHTTGGSLGLRGVNELDVGETAALPLLKVPGDNAAALGGLYRLPVVEGAVNGKPGVRVLLDSGSNRNLFGYSLARRLGINIIAGVPPVTAFGIGGASDNYVAIVPSMQLGTVEFRKLVSLIGADAQALSFVRGLFGNEQVMIMGVNALRALSYLTIDNLRGTVTIAPRDVFQPDSTLGVVANVPFGWEGELPMIQLMIDNKYPVACLLDTGGDYGMLVPRSQASLMGYWKPGKGPLAMSGGTGGAALATRYEIKKAQAGPATFLQIPARTDLVGPEPGGGRTFLGNIVLRRHRVTFDFRNQRLWLER